MMQLSSVNFYGTRNCKKETLLEKVDDLENSKLKEQTLDLQHHGNDLRKKVVDASEYDFQGLQYQLQDLQKKVDHLKYRNLARAQQYKRAVDALALAQATWVWEAHLARFVISKEPMRLYGRFRQMIDHERAQESNRWVEIQAKFAKWTDGHWDMVNVLREEGVGHPDIDLVALKDSIPRLEDSHQKPMKDMLDILKLVASLMKFGRLARFYSENKNNFPPLELTETGNDALRVIISWDRPFEEIEGSLEKIEHEEAKTYVAKYVNDRGTVNECIKIFDFIKQANGKRLGKFAWNFEKGCPFMAKMLSEEISAINEMKKLFPNPDDEPDITALSSTVAMLHIPDFLPRDLWKSATYLVQNYTKIAKAQ